MTRGFIDGATITSALTYLNQGKSGSHPLWHEQSILETTYLLLHEDIQIVPRPKGIGGERGDYAIVATEISELIVDSGNRKQVFKATFDVVKGDNLSSPNKIYNLIKSAWGQVDQNEDFLNWAEIQRADRWVNQSQTYGALYDAESVAIISKVTGYDIKDVERIYFESANIKKVKTWIKRIESLEEAKIANAGWIIGGFMRGFFYDNLAASEGLHMLTHPFRQAAAFPADTIESYDISNTLELIAKIIIANSLNEPTKERRVKKWAESIKNARNFIQENIAEYPKLIDPTTQPKAMEKALMVSRRIDLNGTLKEISYFIDAGISAVIWGFDIAPWASIPFIFLYQNFTKKFPGESIADFFFKSNSYYRWLANSVPGRIERALPKTPTNNERITDIAHF